MRYTLGLIASVVPMLSGCQTLPAERPPVDSINPLASVPAKASVPGLSLRYFGTTTLALSDGTTTILTDGFFSRPGLGKVATGPIVPDLARIRASLDYGRIVRSAAVLVAHSHHDHAMDAPYVAQLTDARLVGSSSTANIAIGAGFSAQRIDEIKDGSVCHFGAFTISAFATPHSRPTLFPGVISAPLRKDASIRGYRDGGNFTFHVAHPWGNVLIVPSLGYREDWTLPARADVVLLGIGGLVTKRRLRPYWRQFVDGSDATRVYPVHWDNFFKPVRLGSVGHPSHALVGKLRLLNGIKQNQTLGLLPFGDEVVLYPANGSSRESSDLQADGCRPLHDDDDDDEKGDR